MEQNFQPARVFVYFDKDVKVRVPFDAKSLTEMWTKCAAPGEFSTNEFPPLQKIFPIAHLFAGVSCALAEPESIITNVEVSFQLWPLGRRNDGKNR